MFTPPFTRLKEDAASADLLELGHVQGVFGVRGEVRLYLHNRESDLLAEGRDVRLRAPDGRWFRATLSSRSGAGKRVLGRFEGISDRDAAAALSGWSIHIDAAELPALHEDEFYLWQLEGATVRVDGVERGTVQAVQTGEHMDVLVVDAEGDDVFLPCMKAVLLDWDVDAGTVDVSPDAWPEEG